MMKFSGGILAVFLFVIVPLFSECSYVDQNEVGFVYNVTSGKPINETNNPPFDFGWAWDWGWNTKHFVINSEVNSRNFTAEQDENSPFNEALSYDSKEGVTMFQSYTILGRVTDPWAFYTHHSESEYDYGEVEGIKDDAIYQAIRAAGHFVDVKMGELAQNAAADSIRKNPALFSRLLTEAAAEYSAQFGFTITDVIFPDRVQFSGGQAIEEGRSLLRDMNSRRASLVKDVQNADERRKRTINNARIESNKILADYRRLASTKETEAGALAKQLKTSIDQVGVEGTMLIKMSELQGALIRAGVIDKAYLTDKSLFGKPFYSLKR